MAAAPRRSTLSSQGASKNVADDPRPLKDSSFKKAASERVIQFLVARGFNKPVSMKDMASIPTNLYFEIMAFLFQQLDSQFVFPAKRDEELIHMLRHLRYPFQINKGAVSVPGAQHAWPTLLGAMVWVVELLEYNDKVESGELRMNPMGEEQENFNKEKAFHLFLAKNYREWLSGVEQQVDFEDLAQQFDEQSHRDVIKRQQLESHNEKLMAQINEKAVSHLDEEKKRKLVLMSEIEKFHECLKKMEENLAFKKDKEESLRAQAASQKITLAELKKGNADLEEQISQQPVSAGEVSKMRQEKSQLIERKIAGQALLENSKSNLYEAEIQMSKRLTEVEQAIVKYKAEATKLELIPSTARHAGGIDFDIFTNKANVINDILALNIKVPCSLPVSSPFVSCHFLSLSKQPPEKFFLSHIPSRQICARSSKSSQKRLCNAFTS